MKQGRIACTCTYNRSFSPADHHQENRQMVTNNTAQETEEKPELSGGVSEQTTRIMAKYDQEIGAYSQPIYISDSEKY